MKRIEVLRDGSFALRSPDYVDAAVLSQNTAELFTVPADATHVFFSGNGDFYVTYVLTGDTDLVTNGAFATDTSWTKGDEWTIGSGVASCSGDQSDVTLLSQDVDDNGFLLYENKSYRAVYTISRTAGAITPVIGGTAGTERSTSATFTETIVAGSTQTISFSADADFIGTVDNFSLVPIAAVPSADLDEYASELNPTVRYITGVAQLSLVTPATSAIVTLSYYRS